MKLAILDNEGRVVLSWPTTAEAHRDLADLAAAYVHPGDSRRVTRRRNRLAALLRAHLLELQQQTARL